MTGILLSLGYLLAFEALGVTGARFLLPRRRPLDRLWLGLCLGLLEEMTLPALFAFAFSFGAAAHALALGTGAALTAVLYFARDRRPLRPWDGEESALLKQMLLLGVPFALLGGYLQYTHTLRPDAEGALYVGQSTYGDLPMHLSFITGLVGKRFPADYPFYPGHRLSYPFLSDSLSSTFYMMGCSLQAAVILPGTWMMVLCLMGVMILGREMTVGKRTVLLAALLFFLNGGLGFLYDFDQAAGFDSQGRLKVLGRLRTIMEGFYKTPTNQPEPNNLRWSNVICDLMIPQRTLLGGWCMVIPCFYLLETVFRPDRRDPETGWRGEILLGFWAGALPLIHTHSFLALGLSSLGVMAYDLIHGDREHGRSRGEILGRYAVYGALAAALAIPQLIGFTFAQAFQRGQGHSFLSFQFNWVNNPSGRGMRDFYLWFYIKNIGLPFLAMLFALIERDRKQRRIFSAMLPIILAAELIRFQPNEYDNNKLLYLAWLMGCMIVSNWASMIWRRLKGLRARGAMAAAAALICFLSPVLTIARECVSSYQAFGPEAAAAGAFARDHTERDAVFLTGTQHLNPVCALGGRTVVCGPDLWLYWHGFDTDERKIDIMLFYEDPEAYPEILTKYGVDYIYVSSYERSEYAVDEQALRRAYPTVFENSEATVYRVPEG